VKPRAVATPSSFPLISLEDELNVADVSPPDTQVAAGPTELVEMVNVTLSTWDKSGRRTSGPASLDSVFDVPPGLDFTDPRVVFDPANGGRFFASGSGINFSGGPGTTSQTYVAVSTSSAPTSSPADWLHFTVASNSGGTIYDQPKLGVTSDKVVITWSDFAGASLPAEEIWVVEKGDLIAGTATAASEAEVGTPSTARFSVVPAVDELGTEGPDAWLVYNAADPQLAAEPGTPSAGVLEITGRPATHDTTLALARFSPIAATSLPPPADEPSKSAEIDTGDDRFLSAVISGGRVWAGGTDACTPAGDTTVRPCLRLVELAVGAAPATLQDFDAGQAGTDWYFPAPAFNGAGDLIVSFSSSSPVQLPSAAASGQLRSDTNRLDPETIVLAGQTVYTESGANCPASADASAGQASRWGDYSSAAVDPTDGTVWTAAEYAAATSDARHSSCDWGTGAARVTFGAPVVGGVAPNRGPLDRPTPVVLTGTDFGPDSTVTFGSVPSASVTVLSSTRISAVAPASAVEAVVPVTVSDRYGTSAPGGPYRYDAGAGYWFVAADGGVFAFGDAGFFGSTGSLRLNAPIVGMAPTPSGHGYWFVASDGGVFAFGDAGFFGSTGNLRLNAPIVGMAPTPSGHGYWFVAADGGVFAFGDAGFFGSTGNLRLNAPIVGMAPSPSGQGYWFVAGDGGVFAFGDAGFFGSTGAMHLNKPIVGMAPSPSGQGYWFVAGDGGVFAFGDAGFFGSTGNLRLNKPIVGMAPTPSGAGYWFVAGDGGVFAFGDAGFFGSTGAMHLNKPIVDMVVN